MSDYEDDLLYQHHSDTSYEAAVEIEDSRSTLRGRVFRFILDRGSDGATDEEVQLELGMNPSTQRPRRIELMRAKQVADSGERRLTRSGRKAVVWKVVERDGEPINDADGKQATP